MKRKPTLASVLAAIAVLLALGASPALARICNPAGTWISATSGGNPVIVTVSPAAGSTYAFVAEVSIDDPSFGGALPAVDAGMPRGTLRRVGQRKLRLVALRFGWDAELAPVWSEKQIGTMTISQGCKTAVVEALFHYYAPVQDPFGDEAPVFGVFPARAEYVRIPQR